MKTEHCANTAGLEANTSTVEAKTSADEGTVKVPAKRIAGQTVSNFDDVLAIEEPLEIHVSLTDTVQSVAVTMRTPGADKELAVGFLFTEGIISEPSQIEEIINDKCNVVIVALKAGVQLDPKLFERHSFVASSCGVCGKKSIAAVKVKRHHQTVAGNPVVSSDTINALSASMRQAQANFNSTGGIHASALFASDGSLLVLREDVGRHNALDKVIGSQFLSEQLPLNQKILMVSGRASFELVQKASHAGIPILVAVGAPSSLAVSLAQECGMTLIGFARDGRFNIYSCAERISS